MGRGVYPPGEPCPSPPASRLAGIGGRRDPCRKAPGRKWAAPAPGSYTRGPTPQFYNLITPPPGGRARFGGMPPVGGKSFAMNKKILIRGALLILALVAGYLLVTTGGEDSESGQGPGGPSGGGMARGGPGGPGGGFGPASFEVAPVRRGNFVASAEFVGTLQARATADLYAKLNGQILEMRAETGDRVRAGQVLARIDPGELNERVQQAQAAQRMAEATLGERRAALGIARSTAERTRALFEQQLVSQQQNDQAQAEMQGAAAQVQVAEASVSQARANVGAARAELEKALIVAPFSGDYGTTLAQVRAIIGSNGTRTSFTDYGTQIIYFYEWKNNVGSFSASVYVEPRIATVQ